MGRLKILLLETGSSWPKHADDEPIARESVRAHLPSCSPHDRSMRLARIQLPIRPAAAGGGGGGGGSGAGIGLARTLGPATAAAAAAATATGAAWPLVLRRPQQARLGLGLLAGNAAVEGHRYASVKAQGAYKLKNKKTIAKKLGAKRVGDQYVLPGTILYKQRGTIWHAGENTLLGRDHTIHAAVAGYVKYYRDPWRHPDRQYIGVTFARDDVLPHAPHQPRVRRLGMVAVPRREATAVEPVSRSGIPRRVIRKGVVPGLPLPPLQGADDVVPTTTKKAESEAAAAAAVQAASAAAEAATATDAATTAARTPTKGGNSAARRWNTYVRIKRANRVLYLHKDYSYRESNVQIGRLMGTHKGKTAGTQRYGSRHKMLRSRRRRSDALREQKYKMRLQRRSIELAQQSAGRAGNAGSAPAAGKKAKKDKSGGGKAAKAKKETS